MICLLIISLKHKKGISLKYDEIFKQPSEIKVAFAKQINGSVINNIIIKSKDTSKKKNSFNCYKAESQVTY